MKVHLRFAVLAAALSVFAASSAKAQDTTHKPGGLNKVAHDVSNTVKKAGRDTKAEVKRGSSKAHHALQDAGNDTKTALKKTTGIKGSNSEHPGGLNKVARDVSKAGKNLGRSARAKKDTAKSEIHSGLTQTGKEVKADAKKP